MSVSGDTRSQPTLFIRALIWLFRRIGYLVADHPVRVIIGFVILTAVFSLRVPFAEKEDDIKTGYTPEGARAFSELLTFRQFYDGLDPVLLYVIVLARDGGSMNRVAHLNETVEIIDNIGKGFAVKNFTFYDICSNFCEANEPVLQYRNGLIVSETRNGGPADNLMNLSFPITRFIGRDLDLTPHFFGVSTYTPEEMQNSTHVSNIKDLRIITLIFRAQKPNEWSERDIFQWYRTIGDYYRNNYKDAHIRPTVISLAYTQDEVVRTGLTIFPYITIGFAIMCTFSIITVFIGSKYQNLWSVHKITYAVAACITPLMATTTAFGLSITIGLRFGTVLCVTPFIVLAIGVDDAFLMINAWNRICVARMHDGIKENMRERMADVLVDVGPSIMITSLTNTIAFGMGIFMPTPEIRLLCIVTSIALFLDYIYTITIYAAIMSIGGRYELRSQKCVKTPCDDNGESKAAQFLDHYCNWLSSGFTSIAILVFLALYWWTSIKGALSTKPNLTPEKLFLSDSPLIEMSHLRSKYFVPAYTFVTVFVNTPGDLRNSSQVKRIEDMVADFESLPSCNGAQYTHFWMRDYKAYLATETEELSEENTEPSPFSTNDIKTFVQWPEYRHWGGFMKFDNKTNLMSSFFITVAYHGDQDSDWIMRLNLLKSWRAVADKYPDLGASVYEDEALFMDQIEILLPITIQTSLATLACMTVVCFLFMSNVFTVLVAVSTITSICIGVFGLLTLWGINLDPISMSTLIMSIGLSVDFPAHITFHYHRTGLDPSFTSIKERMLQSLVAIGFPLLQCSASTILFVLSLLFVPCYMSEAFVKAIVLVIGLGIAHALVAVPALLCALSNIYQYLSQVKDSQSTSSQATQITKLNQSPVLRRFCSPTGNRVTPLVDVVTPR